MARDAQFNLLDSLVSLNYYTRLNCVPTKWASQLFNITFTLITQAVCPQNAAFLIILRLHKSLLAPKIFTWNEFNGMGKNWIYKKKRGLELFSLSLVHVFTLCCHASRIDETYRVHDMRDMRQMHQIMPVVGQKLYSSYICRLPGDFGDEHG